MTSYRDQSDPDLRAAYRAAKQHAISSGPGVCPECEVVRVSEETLRVHRWLAHDVKVLAA